MVKYFVLFLIFFNLSLTPNCQVFIEPLVLFTRANNLNNQLKLKSVKNDDNFTTLEISYSNYAYVNGWYSIDKNSYLEDYDTGKKYPLIKVSNILASPNKSYIGFKETVVFSLSFQKLPTGCNRFHFIENNTDPASFHLYDICLNADAEMYNNKIIQLKAIIPEVILTYFSDGLSWPDFTEVYSAIQKESYTNPLINNLKKSESYTDKSNGQEYITYSFTYNGTNIYLQKNILQNTNFLITISFLDDKQRSQVLHDFEYLFDLSKNPAGFYTFKNRMFDMISLVGSKAITYLSVE